MKEEKTPPDSETDYVEDLLAVLRTNTPTDELELAIDFIESEGLGHDYLKYRSDYQHDKEIPLIFIDDENGGKND